MRVVKATPVISTDAYANGDAVGGLLTFAGALNWSGFGGIIAGAVLVDKSKQEAVIALQLFDRTFTPTADQAPYDPSAADIENAIANILFGVAAYQAGASTSVASLPDLQIPVVGDGNSNDLFGQLIVVTGTPEYVGTSDLIVKLFMRDRAP